MRGIKELVSRETKERNEIQGEWERSYLCIDLKSFYASCECVERKLDPLTTDLVVADPERSEKTICLAVSPSLKAKGIRNRCRVFEIPNSIDYIMAPPRMALYIEYSAKIYEILLHFVSKDDVHVYSIDESFIDVTNYLSYYHCTARELGERIRNRILEETGIPATCGIGPNLFLAKIALDITAKHSSDFFGCLDQYSFQLDLWDHKPITDFWRIGRGTARRLKSLGIETMGQIALYPHPERLFQMMGIDAEILIDHAWGEESVTISDIKSYHKHSRSLTNGQVLSCGYSRDDARIILTEMIDSICLEMFKKDLVSSSISIAFHYEKDEFGFVDSDGGTIRLPDPSNSRNEILPKAIDLFLQIADDSQAIRRMMVVCNNVIKSSQMQLPLFSRDEAARQRERARQNAILKVKEKYGKNSLLRGTNLLPKATQRERNQQIGGHKA